MSREQYKHAEAFCLMLYRCDGCAQVEVFWNSRDGVTPFVTSCQYCGAPSTHIMWERDKPQPRLRAFVNMTKGLALRQARAHVAKFWDHEEFPMKGGEYATEEEAVQAIAAGAFDPNGPAMVDVGHMIEDLLKDDVEDGEGGQT